MAGLLDNLYLDINGMSRHLGVAEGLPEDIKYNERNPGIGFTKEYPKGKWVKSLLGGNFKNSYGDNSFYGGGSLARRFGKNYYADLGVFGGLATGYDDSRLSHEEKEYRVPGSTLQPMGGLLANLGKKDVGRLGLKYMPGKPGLIMMNLGIPFK